MAYSPRDLNSLYATAHAVDWKSLVTLTGTATSPIDDWARLLDLLKKLKGTLSNWHRRKGFPNALLVTEFSPPRSGEVASAHFHLGFAWPLDESQQTALREIWLELVGSANNQGRFFDYRSKTGGPGLQSYLAKDVKSKTYIKYPAAWLPKRIECRLWFVVGLSRLPAKVGARLRAATGRRRRRFDLLPWNRSEARRQALGLAQAFPTSPSDSEDAHTYITPVSPELAVPNSFPNHNDKDTVEPA